MAAPIPETAYGSSNEEQNRMFRETRGVRPGTLLHRATLHAPGKKGRYLKRHHRVHAKYKGRKAKRK